MRTREMSRFNGPARGLANRRAAGVFVLGVLCTFGVQAAGWQWYEREPTPPEDVKVQAAAPVSQDASAQLAELQAALKSRLAEAILYPNTENFVRFFQMQNYFTQQAGLFERSAKRAFLQYPELDYNLQHSHYNGTVKNQLAADQKAQGEAIKRLAEQYGLMLFYRGADPIDGQLASVVQGFRDTYGLSVVPVTMDGVIAPALPDSRRDSGQAERLGVTHFPALMLVDPKSGSATPLAYGFVSQDDLAKQFQNVLTDFAPNY